LTPTLKFDIVIYEERRWKLQDNNEVYCCCNLLEKRRAPDAKNRFDLELGPGVMWNRTRGKHLQTLGHLARVAPGLFTFYFGGYMDWKKQAPTEKQVFVIQRYGFPVPTTRGEASALIGSAKFQDGGHVQ